jgi:hypothetical protein
VGPPLGSGVVGAGAGVVGAGAGVVGAGAGSSAAARIGTAIVAAMARATLMGGTFPLNSPGVNATGPGQPYHAAISAPRVRLG